MDAAATRGARLALITFGKATHHLNVITIISDAVIVEGQIPFLYRLTYRHHHPQKPKGSNAQNVTISGL